MRLVFLGTPDFAVPALEAVVRNGHAVLAVISQPDRPRGRDRQPAAPPVKLCALRLNLPVHQPERIRQPEFIEWLAALKPEAMVIVGYGKIIPQSIIDIPPRGIINVHASLLPKYRGAAPVQWAIAGGETRTGVTTMRIDAGLDTGDILLQRETAIGPEETAVELGARLAAMGAELLIETLAGLEAGVIVPRPQDHGQASAAPILAKEHGLIDWRRTARVIANQVRGFVPWPGAYTYWRGQLLHIWKARPGGTASGPPGSLDATRSGLSVACGQATSLEILELQLEGRKRLPAAAFLRGCHLVENDLFGGEEA
ncbi:MAG: methionyl-tRNA formyltransferase [Acidobacteriota bacterium]